VLFLQDRFVERKSKASWTCCVGETKTCRKEEGDGSHAFETLIWWTHHRDMYIYRTERKYVYLEIWLPDKNRRKRTIWGNIEVDKPPENIVFWSNYVLSKMLKDWFYRSQLSIPKWWGDCFLGRLVSRGVSWVSYNYVYSMNSIWHLLWCLSTIVSLWGVRY
jgi:hypothetical protein